MTQCKLLSLSGGQINIKDLQRNMQTHTQCWQKVYLKGEVSDLKLNVSSFKGALSGI